jgi:hypothetical protein
MGTVFKKTFTKAMRTRKFLLMGAKGSCKKTFDIRANPRNLATSLFETQG